MKTGHCLLAVALCLAVVLPGSAQEDAPTAPEGGAEGETLFSEDFDHPDRGQMPIASPNPSNYLVSYADGGYRIERINADFAGLPNAAIPGSFGDASISVEGQIEGDVEGRWVYVNCRVQSRPFGGYYLSVSPANGTFVLGRWDNSPDGPGGTTFASGSSPAIQTGNAPNRLELSCAGPRIWASVNGLLVGSVEDSTFSEGRLWLAVWGNGVTASAFFDNLSVARADVASAPPLVGASGRPPAPPSQTAPQQPGSILLADNFDDPTLGRLPKASPEPSHVLFGYVAGEYQIQTLTPGARWAALPAAYSDASVAIDARIVGDETGRTLALRCRLQGGSGYGYRLFVSPSSRSFVLDRWDGGTPVILVNSQPSASIRRANSANRIELICSGSTIAAAINGSVVAAVRDTTYAEGAIWIGVTGSSVTADARFDNLVVTQRDPAEPPPPMPAPPKPGDVLLADNFEDPALGWLPTSAPRPEYEFRYDSGAYLIRKVDPNWRFFLWANMPGTYANYSIAVSARRVGPTVTGLHIACRMQQAFNSGYDLYVSLDTREFQLQRRDGGVRTPLRRDRSKAIRGYPGETNRLELTCSGNEISARANGTLLATEVDSAYTSGAAGIAAEGIAPEVRFQNLVLTQR